MFILRHLCYDYFMKTLIVLVGMMGAGKSTIGRFLSRVIKFNFVDTDKEIEKLENKTISAIFNDYGEKYFREKEKELIKSLSACQNTILALGGGTFENEETRKLLKKNGIVIYLKATPQTLFKRIHTEIHRPLLHKNFSVDTIAFILKKRIANYEKAHYIVDTNNKTPKEIVRKILEVLK